MCAICEGDYRYCTGRQVGEMLLAVDVGNTDVTFGVFNQEDELITRFRFTVKVPRTSDEYGELLCNILQQKGFSPEDVSEVIIASVVPKMMYSFTSGIIKYLHCHPIVVGAGTKTGIRINTINPKEIGPDRIVDAVSAYEQYGGPIIVVDFGTATTYDFVTADGTFQGGLISPGIRISANALWNDTANLPEIEIKNPKVIIAKETISSMQAGLFYGTIGQSEYIIRKIKEEAGAPNAKVVATGGLGKIVADYSQEIEMYDADLTLKGLLYIYKKQR